jgi:hypothetical protein
MGLTLDFIGLGAAKSGTTALDTALRSNRALSLPKVKDSHFFDHDDIHAQGLSWYKNLFSEGAAELRGEVASTYLYSQNVPGRLAGVLGDGGRFLVIMRNPIDRAYSEYLHFHREGRAAASFAAYIQTEKPRWEVGRPQRPPFVYRGLYANYLERYRLLFPRGRFHLILLERFKREPAEEFRRLAEFLDLPTDTFPGKLERVNVATASRFGLAEKVLTHDAARASMRRIVRSSALRGALRRGLKRLARKPVSDATLKDTDVRAKLRDIFSSSVDAIEAWVPEVRKYWDDFS